MIPEVDDYIANLESRQDELSILRSIALECGLTETWKWKQPCYTDGKSNILILGNLKEFCVMSFFKGALLKDQSILTKPGENSQSARYVKISSADQIEINRDLIKALIFESIENEKAGLKVDFKETSPDEFPSELAQAFNTDPKFEEAFKSLTKGRQRGYLLHFNQPKKSETRTNRIEKFKQRILDGYGMNDCTCGHSRRMPNCDGSHKSIKS